MVSRYVRCSSLSLLFSRTVLFSFSGFSERSARNGLVKLLAFRVFNISAGFFSLSTFVSPVPFLLLEDFLCWLGILLLFGRSYAFNYTLQSLFQCSKSGWQRLKRLLWRGNSTTCTTPFPQTVGSINDLNRPSLDCSLPLWPWLSGQKSGHKNWICFFVPPFINHRLNFGLLWRCSYVTGGCSKKFWGSATPSYPMKTSKPPMVKNRSWSPACNKGPGNPEKKQKGSLKVFR